MPPARAPVARPSSDASAGASSAAAPTVAHAASAAPRGNDGVITESSADAGRDVTAAAHPAPRASAVEPPRRGASTALAAASAPPAPRHADGERARALLEGRAASSADEQRFVIQVGAFADPDAARETRKNVEKLGLKTYTQVAQTSGGSRIRVRVGPFASRGEAEAALAKTKAAGLNAVLLTL
jgi:DedD protein